VIQLNNINAKIKKFILDLKIDEIQNERLKIIDKIGKSINRNIMNDSFPNILFVCSHNSRRSQFAEIWAHTINYIFNNKIKIMSAGTFKTAVHYQVINVIKDAGFKIRKKENNYYLNFSNHCKDIKIYSKKINDINKNNSSIIINTCSNADIICSVVPNTLERFLLSYEDPKISDNTKFEKRKYYETCKNIALEIFYLFSNIKQQI